MSRNLQDEIEANEKRQEIYTKANEMRERSHPEADKIAALYEKYSLLNIENCLEHRRVISFFSIHISDWHRAGKPRNEWFYLSRSVFLDKVPADDKEKIHLTLARIVLRAIEQEGENFECAHIGICFPFWDCFEFEFEGHPFVGMKTSPLYPSQDEPGPALSVIIQARIL